MPRDYISLGTSPANEDCVSVEPTGSYRAAMQDEADRWRDRLAELFPPPASCRLFVAWCDHDFGSYAEVRACYEDNDEEGRQWAYHCEEHAPATWGAPAPAFVFEPSRASSGPDEDEGAYLCPSCGSLCWESASTPRFAWCSTCHNRNATSVSDVTAGLFLVRPSDRLTGDETAAALAREQANPKKCGRCGSHLPSDRLSLLRSEGRTDQDHRRCETCETIETRLSARGFALA